MAKTRIAILVTILVMCVTLMLFYPLSSNAQVTKASEIDQQFSLYVFGDSLYDTGTALDIDKGPAADSYPYGETYFKHAVGRFSDGRLIPDFIAQFANLPFPVPYFKPNFTDYSKAVNFADAAAGVLVDGRPNTRMYNQGARKFAFHGFGPVGCLPAFLEVNGNCSASLNDLMKLHNERFEPLAKTWARQLPGLKYSIYDFYTSLMARLTNGPKYGFTEAQSACCGSGPFRGKFTCMDKANFTLCDDPTKYLWFDAGHPTQKADLQFSQEFWSGVNNLVNPYNLKTLFAK